MMGNLLELLRRELLIQGDTSSKQRNLVPTQECVQHNVEEFLSFNTVTLN